MNEVEIMNKKCDNQDWAKDTIIKRQMVGLNLKWETDERTTSTLVFSILPLNWILLITIINKYDIVIFILFIYFHTTYNGVNYLQDEEKQQHKKYVTQKN